MNILQISAPKSGSYWLHTILKMILQKQGIAQRSFIQEKQIYHERLKLLELSFEGQAGVDMVDIEEDGLFYRVGSVLRKEIPDLAEYAANTSLAWTHSTLCSKSFKFFPLYKKKIYIVRDPRDRALSTAKFAFTPYMQKYYPTSFSSPGEYLEHEFGRLLQQWKWYTGNYLLHRKELDIHFVFYERLLHDFENEFNGLLNYLELSLSEKEKKDIAEAVTFSSMKNSSPKHLNKGKYGKWRDQLNKNQIDQTVTGTGNLLQLLNYPLSLQESHLPSLPSQIPEQELQKEMKEMNWEGLF